MLLGKESIHIMCDLVRNHRLFQKAKRKDPDPASKTITVQFAAQISRSASISLYRTIGPATN